jgi:hypothetical protein
VTWFQGVPGIDCRDPADNRELASRVAAFACAARLEPVDVRAARFDDTATAKAARMFLPWLKDARDDQDAYWRRLALAYASDQPRQGVSTSQVLKVARSVHAWLTRGQPSRPRTG